MPRTRPSPTVSALAVVLLFAACGSDPAGPNQGNQPTFINIAGVWTFDVVVTADSGDCMGEKGETWVEDITITQSGGGPFTVNASGFLGSATNTLSGTLSADGNSLVLSGSYPENGGTTAPTHTLNRTSLTRFDGTETWNWTTPGGLDCAGSESSVVAVWK